MEATAFGVMHVDEHDRITEFFEKPADPPGIPGQPDMALAVDGHLRVRDPLPVRGAAPRRRGPPFQARFRRATSSRTSSATGSAVAHRFERPACVPAPNSHPYWRDVGTIDAYWQANIDLTEIVPELDLYDRDWPIWTHAEVTPPAKFVHDIDGRRGEAVSSLVSGGCIVSGARTRRSLLFTGAHLHSHAVLEGAVVLPEVDVGRGARLTNVVVDRGVRIPPGLVVGEDPVADAARFRRTDAGVCLITQSMVDRLG